MHGGGSTGGGTTSSSATASAGARGATSAEGAFLNDPIVGTAGGGAATQDRFGPVTGVPNLAGGDKGSRPTETSEASAPRGDRVVPDFGFGADEPRPAAGGGARGVAVPLSPEELARSRAEAASGEEAPEGPDKPEAPAPPRKR